MVGAHFEKTQKVIDVFSNFYSFRGKDFHFATMDESVRLKISTVSKRQLEGLGELLKLGKESDADMKKLNESLPLTTGSRYNEQNMKLIDDEYRSSLGC